MGRVYGCESGEGVLVCEWGGCMGVRVGRVYECVSWEGVQVCECGGCVSV